MTSKQQLALALTAGLAATPKAIDRIGAKAGVEEARWAFTQWELRRKGRKKFEGALEMLFDRDGLEMATHERIAAYHASRFEPGELVGDLTVGVGADLVALAKRGPTVGYEISKERRDCARHNLLVEGVEAEVWDADCFQPGWEFDAAFADPARRGGGVRHASPEQFEPNPKLLMERMKDLRLGGIKLSPMLPDAFLESMGGRLEFVSYGRECREALIWTGRDAEPGRFAVHVESGESIEASDPAKFAKNPSAYLYEADPAAIRAHALGSLCEAYGLAALAETNGYLTGRKKLESPWLRGFKVVYHGKGDAKATQKKLRELKATVTDVKTRGKTPLAENLKSGLKPAGKRHLVLAAWLAGSSLKHTLLERIAESP